MGKKTKQKRNSVASVMYLAAVKKDSKWVGLEMPECVDPKDKAQVIWFAHKYAAQNNIPVLILKQTGVARQAVLRSNRQPLIL